MIIKTEHKLAANLVGTSHWCGTIDGHPAFLVAFHGGARLWTWNKKWTFKNFESLACAMKWLEENRG